MFPHRCQRPRGLRHDLPQRHAFQHRRQRSASLPGQRGGTQQFRQHWHDYEANVGEAAAPELMAQAEVCVARRPNYGHRSQNVTLLLTPHQMPQQLLQRRRLTVCYQAAGVQAVRVLRVIVHTHNIPLVLTPRLVKREC